jgi:hypothetical protein
MKHLILEFFATLVQTHKFDCCVIVTATSTMHNRTLFSCMASFNGGSSDVNPLMA